MKFLGFIALFAFSGLGHAQDNSNATRLKELSPETKKFRTDQSITDNELKAQAGSLSKYSVKFDLSYSGPAINDLADPNMPNPDNRPRPNRTSLSGYTGLRYRLDSQSAVGLSTGLRWYTPYQQVTGAETEKPKGEQDFEMVNAQISADRVYAFGKAQMRSTIDASYITQDFFRLRGQVGAAGFAQSTKYSLGRTTLGLTLDFDHYFFNRGYRARWENSRSGDGKISNYSLAVIPSVEYRFTDRFGFRTSTGWSYLNFRSFGNAWTWQELEPTARVGFNYAVTREIYFNPYLGFYSKRPSISTTNIAFTTVFSIF